MLPVMEIAENQQNRCQGGEISAIMEYAVYQFTLDSHPMEKENITMKSRLFKFGAALMLLAVLASSFAAPPAGVSAGNQPATSSKQDLAVSETGLYIVRLQDASLAGYRGGIAGLSATSPEITGARKLDPTTADSQAYLAYLSGMQGELLRNMSTAYGRPVEAVYQYKNVLNAVAVRISHEEALRAFNLPGVTAVYPDEIRQLQTDAGPILIGAPSIWTGDTLDGSATYGEGIIIGVIDTGINHAHPSFADTSKDGFNHTNPYGAGNYVGVCATDPAYAAFCNDKLIGAYDLTTPYSGGPEDENGHGSHTASTAGGNFVDVEFDDGVGGTFTVQIQGVAPHANLIAYRVCTDAGGCQSTATIASVEHAIPDMVDVLNYSISGADDPWNDPVDLAFLDAFTAGIFVSASAGNDGPDPSTVAKTGPWNASVAGTTHNRIIAHMVDARTDSDSLVGLAGMEGTGPLLTSDIGKPIIYGGDVDATNYDGCDAWVGTPFTGSIGLVQRGSCTFATKVNNLAAAGAVAALVYNNVGGPPIIMGGLESTTIPSLMLSLDEGTSLVALISGDSTATATLYAALGFAYGAGWGDYMYDFSSRGPSQWELVKPDYGAPAVNVLAAVAASGGNPVQYDFYSGTSMAAPHGSGSAALLMALHPDWSPAAVKSAIATTAFQGVIDTDGTPANPFDIGSGRINLSAAAYAGFVMEETTANYIAADPYLGGEPNTLNQPSMVEYDCVGTCTWTRTLESTLDHPQEWQFSFTSDAGMILSASPITFTLPAGGMQVIEITADVSAGAFDTHYFGNVILTPAGSADVSPAHLPVVAMLGISNLPSQLDILTDQLTGTVTLSGLQSYLAIEDLYVRVSGLALGDAHDLSLMQDPTNSNAFDDLSQVFWTNISVPSNAERLVAEIVASEAPDVDLFIGTGATPTSGSVVCTSASGIWNEYCNIDNPANGTYWVLVQNWQGSAAQPDAIRAITGLVVNDEFNLSVTGPAVVPAQQVYELDVSWDEPSMVSGDYWYAQFSVGTDQPDAGNLGTVNVDLEFFQAFYAMDLAPAVQDGYGDPGGVALHTLTLTNQGNVPDTYELTYADNLWETALPETSFALGAGESVDVLVSVSVPADALAGVMDSATITATSTTDPLLEVGVVVNTYANAVYALELTPPTDSAGDSPGQVVTYTLTLANLGNALDTVSVAASGNLWEVNLPLASYDIPAGGTAEVVVEVTLPADALAGDFDVATITATSEGGVTAEAELTTSALTNWWNYRLVLPLMTKE